MRRQWHRTHGENELKSVQYKTLRFIPRLHYPQSKSALAHPPSLAASYCQPLLTLSKEAEHGRPGWRYEHLIQAPHYILPAFFTKLHPDCRVTA